MQSPIDVAYDNGLRQGRLEGANTAKTNIARANVRSYVAIVYICGVTVVFLEKGATWGFTAIAGIALLNALVWTPDALKKK